MGSWAKKGWPQLYRPELAVFTAARNFARFGLQTFAGYQARTIPRT